jgi:hypothetical protein
MRIASGGKVFTDPSLLSFSNRLGLIEISAGWMTEFIGQFSEK